jgi:phage-related protein
MGIIGSFSTIRSITLGGNWKMAENQNESMMERTANMVKNGIETATDATKAAVETASDATQVAVDASSRTVKNAVNNVIQPENEKQE